MTVEQLGQKPVWIEFFGASGSGKTTLVNSIPSAAIATVALESGSSANIVLVHSDVPVWNKVLSVARLTVVDGAILKMALEIYLSLMRLGMVRKRARSLVAQYLYLRSSEIPGSRASRVTYLCDQGYVQLIASALVSCPGPPDIDHFFQELPHSFYFPHSVDILPMYLRRNGATEAPALVGGLPSQSGGASDIVFLRLSAYLGVPMVRTLEDVTSQLLDSPSPRFNPWLDL